MKKLMTMIGVMIFVWGSKVFADVLTTTGSLSSENLKLLLEYGGLPAAILILGYLYLRIVLRDHSVQMKSLQEQLSKTQETMITVLQNNTEALTRLSTVLLMGCPLMKQVFEKVKEGDRQSAMGV